MHGTKDAQPAKSREQTEFEEEMRRSKPIFDTFGFYWRFMFGWVDVIVAAGRRFGLTLDMLPNLTHEFQHRSYSNKIRFYCRQLLDECRAQNAKPSKYFILRLLYRAFKFDMLLTLLWVTLLTALEYSSPFFLYKMLSIPEVYDRADYLRMFLIYGTGLVLTKVFNSILNDNVYFHMVGSPGRPRPQKQLRLV